ncbi:Ribonucleases P/MRP protein subunit [Metarhizium guizhouense ARSEF 977]|uniref:Ribonucleases P/MRP protein subunit n=1 Tax=Metarhizium guizhouense (strain ARSEF 977) TaxID=1276136 RepID=A0A0B4GQ95_METGA|nr:Ribonucleases P/MRP protein subunit [Metarhizium guizhouense ARSEF 977]
MAPTTISGGCLCEGVRYTITFPADHDFTAQCSTCQCSQCRKQTGSLIFRAHRVPVSSLRYTSQATLSEYRASPGNARGFCSRCGSLLFWRHEASDRISMCVGCFDQEALREHGRLLTYAERHLFCGAEIDGVTDHLPGSRYKYDDDDEGEGEVVLLERREPH